MLNKYTDEDIDKIRQDLNELYCALNALSNLVLQLSQEVRKFFILMTG